MEGRRRVGQGREDKRVRLFTIITAVPLCCHKNVVSPSHSGVEHCWLLVHRSCVVWAMLQASGMGLEKHAFSVLWCLCW